MKARIYLPVAASILNSVIAGNPNPRGCPGGMDKLWAVPKPELASIKEAVTQERSHTLIKVTSGECARRAIAGVDGDRISRRT
ncbi:MAG: hypothetical protein ACRD6N_01575 [Pyrinomonadaceae bacterium]